jgi:hypothetical protein
MNADINSRCPEESLAAWKRNARCVGASDALASVGTLFERDVSAWGSVKHANNKHGLCLIIRISVVTYYLRSKHEC